MVPLKSTSFLSVIVCAFLASMLPAVNGAAYYVSSSYWCGSYQYGCGKGCYATAANSCYKYDCPAGQSGTYYTPRVNTCYSCPSGRYTPAANHIDSCYYCPGGTYQASSGQTSCNACPGGYYCPYGATTFYACPGGYYCPSGSSTYYSCPAGRYSPSYASACTYCPGGNYQSSATKSSCSSCPVGYYCPYGATTYYACPGGYYCPSGTSTYASCPAGRYSPSYATACTYCPGGKYQSLATQTSCIACPAGYYCPYASTSAKTCPAGYYCPASKSTYTLCPAGTYCPSGAGTTTSCGTGNYDSSVTAVTTSDGCTCAEGWTGSNCDQYECSSTLDFISLGLLLIEGSYPEELRESGTLAERTTSQWTTYYRVNSIIRTADTNGDEYLSTAEAVTALELASLEVPADVEAGGIVWASPGLTPTSDYTSWTKSYDSASISTVVTEAVSQFILTGTFYGYAGADATTTALYSADATYPDSTWDSATCVANNNNGVTLSWTFDRGTAALYQQCGYMNGMKLDETSFTDDMVSATDCTVSGTTTSCDFTDPDDIATNGRKRLYCIYSTFCADGGSTCTSTGTDVTLSRLLCTTGLVYDGSPADVFPSYTTRDGVKFQFLDTSVTESGFRIYRDTFVQTTTSGLGQLIADIPFTSQSCGQQFAPLQYADRDVGDIPGKQVTYIVASVDSDGEVSDSTKTRVKYTQPWVSDVMLKVTGEDGKSPVSDVELRIQHILDDSSIDASFGEFMLTTATLGTVSTEIRVADAVNWYSPTQQFYVTPAKCSGTWVGDNFDTRTCNGILHSFEPEVELTELKHLFEGITEFTDITSFAIKGYVIYGESLNSSSYRPEYDAGDWDTSTCPTMFGSQCYCPVESAPVSIDLELSEDKDLMSDEDGYFAETAGYGEEVVFSFKGFQGHTFELWNVTGGTLGTFSDDRSSLTFELLDVGTMPSVNFTANGHSFFVLVDVRERNLLVQIQGGDEAIGFISGQRVLAERESCGYSKELVTYKGEINNHLIAAELVVSIPDDYSSDVASCSVLGGIRAGDRTEDDPCRVPVPNVVSNSSRLTCATSPFTFIDEYFTDVGESSQTVDLGSVRSNTFNLTYTYLAPLCMKAIVVALPTDYRVLQKIQHCNGVSDRTWPPSWVNDIDGVYMTESLLLDTPTIDSDYEDTVYGKADDIDERAIFCESDKFNVSFHLVEVYPTDETGLLCDWPEDFEDDSNSFCTLNYYPENDFSYEMGTAAPKNQGLVSTKPSSSYDITVTAYDGVSGDETTADTYDSASTWGYVHEVFAADPNPFTPFTNVFEVKFERTIHEGDDYVDFLRRIVTLGVIPDDVPALYTMTTEPTLIYTVLHDPPGGGSFTTLVEGSTVSTTMDIEGMHAGDLSDESGYTIGLGISVDLATILAPFGFGIDKNLVGLKFDGSHARSSTGPTISIQRSSNQAFELKFTFDMEIATSDEPDMAGSASDLILGGGMNLRILQAIKVGLESGPDSSTGLCNVYGKIVSEWLPEQVTTWLMTPYQIEATITRLYNQYQTDVLAGNETNTTLVGIKNWNTVLENYRSSMTSSTTPLEEAVSALVEGVGVAVDEGGLAEMVANFNGDDADGYYEYLVSGLANLNGIRHDASNEQSKSSRSKSTTLGRTGQQANTQSNSLNRATAAFARFTEKVHGRLKHASSSNCEGGNSFGLGALCDSISTMQSKVTTVSNLLAICDLDTGIDAVERFCTTQDSSDYLPASAFDALENSDHLVTFTGASSTTMTYGITQSKEQSQAVSYTTSEEDKWTSTFSGCVDIARRRLDAAGRNKPRLISNHRVLEEKEEPKKDGPKGLCRRHRKLGVKVEASATSSSTSSLEVNLARSSARGSDATHEISFTLSDPDPRDFFAVQIVNDELYGTPIFRTMGGISRAPGETATAKRDSGVTLAEIKHYCDGYTWCTNLEYGTTAYIGVVIQNISPVPGPWVYKLYTLANAELPWQDGTDYCGESGYTGGLLIQRPGSLSSSSSWPGYSLFINYGQSEVLLELTMLTGWTKDCLVYEDVALALVSIDENIDTDVYQYRTELDASTGTVSIVYPTWDYDSGSWVDGTGAFNPWTSSGDGYDEISFSVSWAEEDTTATVTGTESSVATSIVFDGVSESEFTDEMQTALINTIVAQSDTITDASMISGITLTESTRRLAGSNGTNGTNAATSTELTVGFDVAFDLEDQGFTLTGDTSAAEEFAVTLVTSLATDLADDTTLSSAFAAESAALGVEVPDTMSVNSEATNAALAAASESIVTAAVVVYTPTPPPTSAPVQTPAPTASSSSTTSDEFISRTNFLYFAGVFGGIFLMMCMVIHKQRSMLATLNPKSNQGSSMGFFKKKAVDGLSEREHQALKEAFATDAKAGDLSGHALAATTVNGLLRLGGLERFQGALAEIGIDDTEFFFDGHTLNDSTLMRIVGMNRGEVERLREVIANAEKPSDTLETVFNMVDLDGNGDLSKDEMIAAADKLNMTADQAAKLFEALDEDGSGHISKNEFSKNFRFSISGLARDGVSLPGPSMPQMSVSGMSLPPFSEMSPMAGISLSSMPSIASMPQTSISGVFASLTGGASSDESIDKKSGLNPLSTLNTKGPSTSL